MNLFHKLVLACIPVAALSACGGSDTDDRLDVRDPVVRYVNASATSPNVTLFRAEVAQPDATNVGYRFASNYFDVATDASSWSVRPAAGGTSLGSVSIPAQRGNRYTIVSFATSLNDNTVYLITDPYNKPLGSNSARVRLMHAAYNAGNVDVYLNAPNTDIAAASVNPSISNVAFGTAGPATGSDSVDAPGGTYQLTVTLAGTKTVAFRGQVSFSDNQDLLVLAVPNGSAPNGVRALVKVEGTAGASEIAPI